MPSNASMWFGTAQFGEWIRAPRSDADVSPVGVSEQTSYLNGGAGMWNSSYGHREYNYEWSKAQSRDVAWRLQEYRDGARGFGLIHHIDPLTMDRNVLEKRWAQPSLTTMDAPLLLPGSTPVLVNTPTNSFMHPIQSAQYAVTAAPVSEPIRTTFVPIPTGMQLQLGATGSSTGTGAIYVTPVLLSGADAAPVALTWLALASGQLTNTTFSSSTYRGVRIWPGRATAVTSVITHISTNGQILPVGSDQVFDRWRPGMGHSGCRFDDFPSLMEYSGIGGGTIGHATKLVEVGAWRPS